MRSSCVLSIMDEVLMFAEYYAWRHYVWWALCMKTLCLLSIMHEVLMFAEHYAWRHYVCWKLCVRHYVCWEICMGALWLMEIMYYDIMFAVDYAWGTLGVIEIMHKNITFCWKFCVRHYVFWELCMGALWLQGNMYKDIMFAVDYAWGTLWNYAWSLYGCWKLCVRNYVCEELCIGFH